MQIQRLLHIPILLGISSLILTHIEGRTSEEWKSRIIYQLLTDRFSPSGPPPISPCTTLREYCGGTFKGVQQRLDYIADLGTNAIWISPIVENTEKGYHGYWAKNIYTLNPKFGTEQDFKDLIKAAHEKDIWIMVDVVLNHMGYAHNCFWTGCSVMNGTNFTGFTPFDQESHYHSFCEIRDWTNQTSVEYCRLAYLPDLAQENPYVRETLLDWIGNLTVKYGIDGYRIDTIVEVPKWFWIEVQERAGVFCMGEASSDDPAYVGGYQGPLDAVLNYPAYHVLKDVYYFNKSIKIFPEKLKKQRQFFKDMSVLGLFADNHDTARFLNLTTPARDVSQLKNAMVYVMLGEGIPIIYYGTEQSFSGGWDPEDRESLWPHYDKQHTMYKFISSLSKLRRDLPKVFSNGPQMEMYADDDVFVFTRGENQEVMVVMAGKGTSGNKKITITGYKDGTVLQNAFNAEDQIQILKGTCEIAIENGQPKVYKITTPIAGGSKQIGIIKSILSWCLVITVLVLLRRN